MVGALGRRTGTRTLLAAAALTTAACGGDVFEPTGPEPLVYVVLNQTTIEEESPVQRAFLLDADSVLPPYRSADRFEMTRMSDGTTFEWRDRGFEGGSPFEPGGRTVPLAEGNFELVSGTGSGGGVAALVPGVTYTLRIETEGVAVEGSATIPKSFEAALEDSGGRRILSWPHVEGAAGYALIIPTEGLEVLQQIEVRELGAVRRDTSVVLPDFLPEETEIHVRAMDENLTRGVEGELVGRGSSGIEGGRGVFGALSVATVTLGAGPSPEASR